MLRFQFQQYCVLLLLIKASVFNCMFASHQVKVVIIAVNIASTAALLKRTTSFIVSPSKSLSK